MQVARQAQAFRRHRRLSHRPHHVGLRQPGGGEVRDDIADREILQGEPRLVEAEEPSAEVFAAQRPARQRPERKPLAEPRIDGHPAPAHQPGGRPKKRHRQSCREIATEKAAVTHPRVDDIAKGPRRLAEALDVSVGPEGKLGERLLGLLPHQERAWRFEYQGRLREHLGGKHQRTIGIRTGPRGQPGQLPTAPVFVRSDQADKHGHHAHEQGQRDELGGRQLRVGHGLGGIGPKSHVQRNGDRSGGDRAAPAPAKCGRHEEEQKPRQHRQRQAAEQEQADAVAAQVGRMRRVRPARAVAEARPDQQAQRRGVGEKREREAEGRTRPVRHCHAQRQQQEDSQHQPAPCDQGLDVNLGRRTGRHLAVSSSSVRPADGAARRWPAPSGSLS